jgi:RNA polymerase sigma factor (sigma-70 family)
MEPELLGDLIDRLAATLELYARQWCGTPEDVVQEAFLALASQPRPPASPEAWLFRAVRNGAINAGIASRRRLRHEAGAAIDASAWFEVDPPGRLESTVAPDVAQAALENLPIAQREVIVAHLWGGLTFDQIAEIAGTSSSSAHRLYRAGLLALRERLGVPCRSNTPRPNPNPNQK